MWVREKLSELLITQGSYNLQVHPINIPHDINAVIKLEEKKATKSGKDGQPNISLAHLFPNPKLRAFALERVQMLHKEILLLIYLPWLQEKGNHYCLLRLVLWI